MSQPLSASLDGDGLVARVLAGEREAFAQIVRHYQRDVWKVAAVLAEDRLAMENLVQQTFVNAFERLHQYQPGRDVGLWLKGIARNLMREELRRRSRERSALARYHTHVLTTLDDDADADDRERGQAQAIAACRTELAPAAARALALYYDEGRRMDEIAGVLGRTATATRLLVFRARLALRACIARRLSTS